MADAARARRMAKRPRHHRELQAMRPHHAAVSTIALAATLLLAGSAGAQQTALVDDNASYSFSGQSMWGPGSAVQFDYSQFVGIDSNPAPVTINPGAISSST
ncbi:MAG TPA: hypothetical protein VFT98_04630, partial [Myxococcota bacterium]|nr:hypothetical protein [Myxococcota bacterium]